MSTQCFCVHSMLQCHWKKSCFEFGQAFTHVCGSSMFLLSTSILSQSCEKKICCHQFPSVLHRCQTSAESLFARMHGELLIALVLNHPVLHVCHRLASNNVLWQSLPFNIWILYHFENHLFLAVQMCGNRQTSLKCHAFHWHWTDTTLIYVIGP